MERYVIPSVMQALQLCKAIAESRSGLSASEIESALKLPRTSVFRLLRTLTSERVVEKRGTKYFYGTRIYEISAANSRSRYVQRIVAPALSKLITTINASAIICTLGDYCAFVIDVLDARQKQITTIRPGTKLPLFESAAGHVMLAYLPKYQNMDDSKHLANFDEKQAATLRATTCTRGFAVSHFAPRNVTLVAVPVFMRDGELVSILAIELEGMIHDVKVLQAWSAKLKDIARLPTTGAHPYEQDMQ
ncbi:IclR family transcriptional regulator [Alteromonas macleodii]|uniref:IclR family transcriptional regulator n=1 Tax=Alteromonas macleodii TaxID=28108 RepID=UPI00313E8B77